MCLHWLYYYVSHRLAPQQCLAFYWYCFFFHPSSLCFFFFSLLYYFYWPYRFTNSHIPGLSLFCKPWFRDLHPAYLYKETALYNHCMRPNSNHPYSTLHIQHSIKYARSWSQYWMVLSIAIAALWKYTYGSLFQFDFDESVIQHRFCVNPNVDDKLDEREWHQWVCDPQSRSRC